MMKTSVKLEGPSFLCSYSYLFSLLNMFDQETQNLVVASLGQSKHKSLIHGLKYSPPHLCTNLYILHTQVCSNNFIVLICLLGWLRLRTQNSLWDIPLIPLMLCSPVPTTSPPSQVTCELAHKPPQTFERHQS